MARQHLFILTGASRGMGAAIAGQLVATPDHRVLCLSRQRNAALDDAPGCEQWAIDLAQPIEAAARVQAWLAALDGNVFASATLINNAAALTRIGSVADCSDDELSSALRVGIEAPLLLTAAFLRATREWAASKRVLNISSGLGRRAMAGQATYCAVKAGLDHFTRSLALDEAQRPNGAKVVALAPGVIDTDMQVQLRAGDPAAFPDRANFVALKEKGQLTSPQDAAARILAYLDRADFGTNPVADVRDA
ncbi:MAG TPA: SDR family NAD(P)-dependent oxidoreductase [Burkholderiaceae bacterium]|jgi:NAD(P)-dependent dehydrogenase (short-subunit alcohol dehydrogenase family)